MKVIEGNLLAPQGARFALVAARFNEFVVEPLPGEPLRLEIWNIGAGDASFRVVAGDRNVVVQDFGRCEFHI